MSKHTLIAVSCAVALLAACGGGGGEAPAPMPPAATDAVPQAASADAQGLKKYLSDLSRDTPDTKEALDLSGFDPKLVDDAEPEEIR